MRRSTIGLALGTALLCATAMISATTAAATPAPTELTVARPVTATGHAAPGYVVTTVNPGYPVDCRVPDPSRAGVDKGVLECGPTASNAKACWRSATPKHVLCLFDASSKKLVSYKVGGRVGTVKAARKDPWPLTLKLTDGTTCQLRYGGAGAILKQHPSWGASYYCTGTRSLWARPGSSGINRAHPSWTVQIASDSGKQKLRTAHVAHAWLVGTHA